MLEIIIHLILNQKLYCAIDLDDGSDPNRLNFKIMGYIYLVHYIEIQN